MFDWLHPKKERATMQADTNRNDLIKEIDRLKGEYQCISNNITDIHESLRRFEITLEIVKLADSLGRAIGNTYSGEVICDYQHAVHQITNRLWDIRFSGKVNYHNEHKKLQIQAESLFNWKSQNHQRWWSDNQQSHDYEIDRAAIKKLTLEIDSVLRGGPL